MVFLVRNSKTQEVHLRTEDYAAALQVHTKTSNTWLETIYDLDLEDFDDSPYYPDALFDAGSHAKVCV